MRMRRTIKLTNRQAEMVCAMFVGNEKDEHYNDDEIRELVTLMWEWRWGVGRSLLDAIGVSRTDGALGPASLSNDNQQTVEKGEPRSLTKSTTTRSGPPEVSSEDHRGGTESDRRSDNCTTVASRTPREKPTK
jgi:hypothetical protein